MTSSAYMASTVGVILAGGRSSRMGVDKAQVVVGSRTMLGHVLGALGSVCDEVIVAGGSEAPPGVRTLSDSGSPHRGPLAGLAAAVAEFPNSVLTVVAVDQPWVQVPTLRRLLDVGGELPVLPVDDGIRQTTCAVYPAAALDNVSEELEGGGSIQSLLDRISFQPVIDDEWRTWGEDGRSWFSADSATELEAGLDRFGEP